LAYKIFKAKYFPKTSFIKAWTGDNSSYTWRSLWGAKSLLKEGLRWLIGNGANVRAWEDQWILVKGFVARPSTDMEFNPDLRVWDLINHETGEWNERIVQSIFSKEVAAAVTNMPLSSRNQPDLFQWWPCKDGLFTVESAYWMGRLGVPDTQLGATAHPDEEWWKHLWKMEIPPKLQHFSWRASNNLMAVGSMLKRRHIKDADTCPISEQVLETINHVIFDCSLVKTTWETSDFAQIQNLNLDYSFLDLSKWVLEKIRAENVGLFLSLAWACWTMRNKVVLGNELPNPKILTDSFTRLVREYKAYSKKVFHASVQMSTRSFEKWVPPPPGWIKVNSDAAIIKEVRIGLGWVACDHEGRILEAGVKRLKTQMSAEIAEAAAARWAIQIASERTWDRVII